MKVPILKPGGRWVRKQGMRNRWPLVTFVSCLALIAATGFLSVRSRIPMQVTESNGYRNFTVRKMGLFPVYIAIPEPGLNVTADAKAELKRLGLTMPKKANDFLTGASHSFQKESQCFSFQSPYPGSPKEAYNDFRSWFGPVSQLSLPKMEQVIGATPGKKASLYFTANDSGGVTYVNIMLGHPWRGELPEVPTRE